jgi:hypothetical protein
LDYRLAMNIMHAITLAALLHHAPATHPVVCQSGTVSYKFTGTPGSVFTYGGERYSVPATGSIELLGEGTDRSYLASSGRTLPLDVWPIDAFGTRTVPLQAAAGTEPAATSRTESTTDK